MADQVYTAELDTRRYSSGVDRMEREGVRAGRAIGGAFAGADVGVGKLTQKILAGGLLFAGWRAGTAAISAFAEQSEHAAKELDRVSKAWTGFKAEVGRGLLGENSGSNAEGLFSFLTAVVDAPFNVVEDAVGSAMSGTNAFGSASKAREGLRAGEARQRAMKEEAAAAKEAARVKKEADEEAKRAADEAAKAAERARDLEGRARVERMNLAAEAARLDGDEGRAGALQRAADLEEKKLAIARQYTDEKQKQVLLEETIINAGRAEDAARRAEETRLKEVGLDAASAARARLLGGFGGNNATSGAAQLAALRFEQAEEVRRLRERGASGDVIDQLVGAQGAEERALIGSLVRGVVERRQLSKSVGAGLGGVVGLSGQVVGGDRGDKAKAEAAQRRLEELAGKILRELQGIGRNTAEVPTGGGVAVFGA